MELTWNFLDPQKSDQKSYVIQKNRTKSRNYRLQNLFKLYDIDATKWDVIRKTAMEQADDGKEFINIALLDQMSDADIKKGIESYIPDNNRSQIIKKKSNTIILDAYNANPSSMKVALDTFKSIDTKSKTVILGDMFELGTTSLEEHKSVMDLVQKLNFNNAYFVGDSFYQTKTENNLFKTFEELFIFLKKNPLKNQSILIKGSRGMGLERLVDILN